MKKIFLLQKKSSLILMMMLLCSFGLSAQVVHLNATFSDIEGTGGNDGSWSGTAAGAVLNEYTGWTLVKVYKGDECVKVGTGTIQGSITTPALTGLSGNATLTFRAGAWNGGSEQTDLMIEISGGGEISPSSVKMVKGSFSNYTINITNGTANTKITFKGKQSKDSRFFLDDVVVTSVGEATEVLAPVITPATGTYYEPVSVTMTCPTADAVIRYTTDGTDPAETSQEYTEAFQISQTTTVKAKAWKETLTPSPITTVEYTVITPEEIATIAGIREKEEGTMVKYTGEATITFVATSTAGNRNAKYIQDETGAIVIDDNEGKITGTYAIGDHITGVTGKLVLYNGMLQIEASTDAEKTDTPNEPLTPEVIEIEDLTTENQAQLITVENITLVPGEGKTVFERGVNVGIEVTSSVVVRPQFHDLNYIDSDIPTEVQKLTGVLLVYTETLQIVPRASTDIVTTPETGIDNPQSDFGIIYASSGNIHVIIENSAKVIEVYDVLGQKIADVSAIEGLNTIPVSKSQIYIVKIGDYASKVIVK